MPKIDLAEKKWARKMATAGPRWKAHVTGKESAYCKGVAEFLGVATCSPEKMTAYREGVGAVSAEDFATAVRGKEAKWRARYTEAMVGS
jgi:hypothetical protein